MKRTPILGTLALLCASSLAAGQTTWYVDGSGTPPGSGTQADPWTEIQTAIDDPGVVDDDRILVAPGAYEQRLVVFKHLTIESSGGPEVTILEPDAPGTVVTFRVSDYQRAILDGFTVRGAYGSQPNGVDLGSGTVRHCIVRDNDLGSGIFVSLDGVVTDSTIVSNRIGVTVAVHGGLLLDMRNSICAGNSRDLAALDFHASVDYSIGLRGFGHAAQNGVGNIVGDPELWSLAGRDLHPRPGSPCIDAGDPASPADPDGSRRDIGFFGYDPTHAPSAPTTYCTAKVNSLFCLPHVEFTGVPSVTSNQPFDIRCEEVRFAKSGLLFYGTTARATPYQGGWLCVASPSRRTELQRSTGSPFHGQCMGLYSYDFNARIRSGRDPALTAGTSVFAQYWYRDRQSSFHTGRSDAIGFVIKP